MALPLTRGGHGGGGTYRHSNINPEKAEHGPTLHSYAPLLDLCKGARPREGARVALRWWEQSGIDWEKSKAKEMETEATSGLESGTDTEGGGRIGKKKAGQADHEGRNGAGRVRMNGHDSKLD